MTEIDLFLDRIFLVNQDLITCKVCSVQFARSNTINQAITQHMLSFQHVYRLQQCYVNSKQRLPGVLFSLQMANRKNRNFGLEKYFGKCIASIDLISHKAALLPFYYFLYKQGKELLDPEDVVFYMKKKKQDDFQALHALMRHFNVKLSSQNKIQLNLSKISVERKTFFFKNPQKCERFYEKFLLDLENINRHHIALMFLLIRIPNFNFKTLYEIKMYQIFSGTEIILPSSRITIPSNISERAQTLRKHIKLEDQDYLMDQRLSLKRLRGKIEEAREILANRTNDREYEAFLKYASLTQIKRLGLNDIEILLDC